MALDLDAVSQAIIDRWVSAVATPQSLSTEYDNDDTFKPTKDVPYARFMVRYGESFRADFGANAARHRSNGRAVARLLYPLGTGASAARLMADLVRIAFVDHEIAPLNILFETPTIQDTIKDEKLSRWATGVICPFFVDEFA